MTHEERFEHIEQTIVQIVDMQREQADVQRAQARIQRDHAQAILASCRGTGCFDRRGG